MKRIVLLCLICCFLQNVLTAQERYTIHLVKDINPDGGSYPMKFTVLYNQIIFRARTSSLGIEPWITDGTEEGTYLLIDINTHGNQDSHPDDFTKYGNQVVFTALDYNYGYEPWITDGSSNGTFMIKDINKYNYLSGQGSYPDDYIEFNGKIYFSAQDLGGYEVYVTDGSEQGTHKLKEIGYGDAQPRNFIVFNDRLYFSAKDSAWLGHELWSTDGTEEGTYKVVDIGKGGSDPGSMIVYDNRLYFAATVDSIGRELWRTDGTAEGTELVYDINQIVGEGSSPTRSIIFNDKIFFQANDGVHGLELWCTDGDSAFMIKDINLSGNSINFMYYPKCIYNGWLYFGAKFEDNANYELWKTDGTEEGTIMVISNNDQIKNPKDYILWNGKLLFTAGDNNKFFWITDGSINGTFKIQTECKPFAPVMIVQSKPVLFNNAIYFGGKYGSMDSINDELYKLMVDTTTQDINLISNILVYPNPFNNILNICSNIYGQKINVHLFDINGRQLLQMEWTDRKFSNNMKELKAGVYILRINIGNKLCSKKIIKK